MSTPTWTTTKAAPNNEAIDWRTYNAAILFWEKHSSYDAPAEAKRLSILATKDTLKPIDDGVAYYISGNGDDANNGTSPETAWKTCANLKEASFNPGDVVLFERGGLFYDMAFRMANGVSYGAYGEGPKPRLYGSDRNYADTSLWQKTDVANVWAVTLKEGFRNIGNIVFNHGVDCGIYMVENKLVKNLQFFEDKDAKVLYLYLDKGNPADVYYDIEICPGRNVITGSGSKNVVVENLTIKYTGCHGIGFGSATENPLYNVTVRGCDIGYIGGSQLEGYGRFVRFGNGIEIYGQSSRALIENNWIYQCYDAGITNQGAYCDFHDIIMRENLVEYCQYNIEVWTNHDPDKIYLFNCQYTDNILRFAGYNFEFDNRHGSNTSFAGNWASYDYVIPSDEKCIIQDNVFDTSYRYLISSNYANSADRRGPRVIGNTYIQSTYKNDEVGFTNPFPTEAVVALLNDENLPCTSQEEMVKSVRKLDSAPIEIIFDGTKYTL